MPNAPQWEIVSVDVKITELRDALTRFGLEGWQIASILCPGIPKGMSFTPTGTVVLQRPLTEVHYPR